MKNSLIAIILMLGLSGCVQYGKLISLDIPNTCDGTGHSLTWVKYGDSHVGALALTDIGRKSEWRFKLQPDSPGSGVYANTLVTIKLKDSTDPTPWLDLSGKQVDGDFLVVCVPETLALNEVIEYMISVEDVGQLDPRGVVVK